MKVPALCKWGRLVAALVFGVVGTAQAHGVSSDIRVDIAPLKIPGLVVELHQDLFEPQLVVSNRTGKPLEILDADGRAFLRIGPVNAEADLASKAFHLSRVAGGGDVHARTLSETPRWRPVAATPDYGWFDARIATAAVAIPYAIRQIGEEMPFEQWLIPARLGTETIELRGVFTYTPQPAGVAMAVLLNAGALAPNVVVQISTGPVPAVFLRNTGTQVVAVLDAAGKPYLKIGRDGIWADTGSAAWRSASTLPVPAGKTGWQQISKANSTTWLEPRAAWQGRLPVPLPASGRLNEWRVPLQIGVQRVELLGANQWIARRAPR